MKRFKFAFLNLSLTLALYLGLVSNLCAQEEEFTLEEIVVTAEKRELNVQDTAISIAAITGDEAREKAQTTLDSVLRDVAGVQVGGFSAGVQVYIRGIGSTVDPEVTDPSNAVMLDGVYSERNESAMNTLYDISRVEVLRGPQGTLYGRNSVGGTINLISNAPSDRFEVNGNFQLGDYNLKHFDGALNFPLSDKMSGRLAFLRELRDGYISNGQENSDKLALRAKLSYKPTDKLSFLLTAERSEDFSNPMATVPLEGSAGNLPEMMPWAEGFDYTQGWVLPEGADDWTTDEYHEMGLYDIVSNTYTVQMDWDLGWGLLTVFPSYSQMSRKVNGDMMLGSAATFGAGGARKMKGTIWSGEARLSSPADSPFQWLVGYYMMSSENEDSMSASESDELSDTGGSWSTINYRKPSDTAAIFGQATYPVTERFRLTLGLRYSLDDKSMDYRFYNTDITDTEDPYYDLATVTSDGRRQYDSGILHYKDSFKTPTGKAGIEYDINEDSMFYAQLSTGFKAGGLNQTAPPTKFDPEELYAYEIGSKNRFMDNRLQFNTELFYYDYNDMQVRITEETIVADTDEIGMAQNVVNVNNNKNYGAEVETDWLATQNDRLKVSLAYLKAEYGDLLLPPGFGGGETLDLTGTQIANSPKWVGTIGYQHSWNLDNGAQVSASFNTKLSSGYWCTIEKNVNGAWQEGFHRSDAYAAYRSSDGKWTTNVWIKNIENKAQTSFVMPFYRRVITDPRTFGVTISFKY